MKLLQTHLSLLLAGAALAFISPPLSAQVDHRIVAETGEDVYPAFPGFQTYEAFSDPALFPQSPAINSGGDVATWARLSGFGITDGVDGDHLLLLRPTGGAMVVARQGDAIPGGGPDYQEFERPRIDDGGAVAFYADLSASGFMVGRWPGANPTQVVYRRFVSQVGPLIDVDLGLPAITILADGTVAAATRLGGNVNATNNRAVVAKGLGGVNVLVFRRDLLVPAVGANLGVVEKLAMGSLSNAVMLVTLDGGPAGMESTILAYRPNGTFTVVAREGVAAPGVAGTNFSDVISAEVAFNGTNVAFSAKVFGPGIVGTNNSGLWVGPPESPVLRVREGSAAPGVAGATLGDIGAVSINADGRVAFFAALLGGGGGVWVENDAGEFVPVGFSGMPSPKAGDPRNLATVQFFNGDDGLSDGGELVFIGQFFGGDQMVIAARVLPTAVVDGAKPTVRITGGRVERTDRVRFRVRGRASDDAGLARVEVKVGRQKWRPARGLERWRTRKPIRLRTDRTRVKVRALDQSGKISKIEKQVVIRR